MYYKRLSFIKKKIFKIISNIKSHINYLVRYILNKMAETINFKTTLILICHVNIYMKQILYDT